MKMRRSIAVLALAGAAACAGRAVPTPEAIAGLPEGDYPLEAWLSYQRIADLAFTVNQPAHVAIFYIAPGSGVSMVYPSYRDELDRTDAGYNVPGYRYDPGQWYFLNTYFSPAATSPSYLLLVASKQPLKVAEYERYPGLLRRTLGLNTFASYDAWDVMDELTQLVVPPQPDDDWSTDLIVLWPPMRANTYLASSGFHDSRLFVRCDNGRVLMVPWDYPYAGCPFFSTYRQPQPSSPLPLPETPDDSTGGTPKPEQPGEQPGAPRPVEPGTEVPKRPAPRPVRPDAQPGEGTSVRVERETPRVIGRRTRQAYPESDTRGSPRAWDRSATAFIEPRQARGASSDFAPVAPGRASRGSNPGAASVHSPSPRSTRSEPRSEPRTERAAPAPRERPSAPERPSSGGSSGSSAGERSSSDRPANDRPSTDRPPR